jgi:hypothetical protein
VAYGSAGLLNARANETVRGVVIELQMAPIRHEVNIAMEPYLGIGHPRNSFLRPNHSAAQGHGTTSVLGC